ncbi:hypothetical protein HYU19_03070 [Candidatus Woesearchaeota archaeon]|nr:hypothetical protein [Candidatus Woesearchaeota archaeon]
MLIIWTRSKLEKEYPGRELKQEQFPDFLQGFSLVKSFAMRQQQEHGRLPQLNRIGFWSFPIKALSRMERLKS